MKTVSTDSTSSWQRRGWIVIVLILLAFIVLAVAYSVTNPLHEATDELRHYRFVRTIALTGELPVQGQERCRSQSHHPPLYYAIGALATKWIDTGRDLCYTPPENPFWAYRYWDVGRDNKNQFLHGPEEDFPWSGESLAVQILRGINILLGAGVVWLTWASSRVIWPKRQTIALGAAAIVAFNPMFLYMSGSINNDVIAALSGAAILFACLYLIHDPQGLRIRWGFILGALFGLALLSKSNLAAAIILIELAITWSGWRKGQWWQWLYTNLLLLASAGLISGWWFLRNLSLYGDLTGFSMVRELWGFREPGESFGLALSELPYAWTTLWGRFGFGQIPLPTAIYDGLFILAVLGLSGALIGFFKKARQLERVSLGFLAIDAILFFLVLFGYMLVSPAGPNGRFFFPALPALAILILYGLVIWGGLLQGAICKSTAESRQRPWDPSADRWAARIVTTGVILGMLVLALVALLGYLAPAYAAPSALEGDAIIPNEVNASFDSIATLLGYEVHPESAKPGESIDLDLYWEVNAKPPGDYLLFVHLTNEQGAVIAQRDTHPGLGNFPSSQWQPGQRFKDSVRIFIPETAYSPATASVSIGLYDPVGFRLAVHTKDGDNLGDALELGKVEIVRNPGELPNAQQQNFNDEIALTGYSYDKLAAEPGETISVDLYWKALADVVADYIVQVRLLDENSIIWADADGRPAGDSSPTNSWKNGQLTVDNHEIAIPQDIPAGVYTVDIALMDAATSQRQNIIANDGHWIDSHLTLSPVKIQPQ